MHNKNSIKCPMYVLVLVVLFAFTCHAQTSSFTYQGKLTDSGVPADGTYDITFKLFDTLASGAQVGNEIVRDDVAVTDGIFSVDLDFGPAAFASGADRFLQIEVRPGASTGAFTPLVPRQPVTSAPYGIKAAGAGTADTLSPACIACVTDPNIGTVSAAKITGVLNQTNGGTGLSAPGASGNFLRSDGANWTSSPLQVSDIPTLNTNFIQNSTTTQPTSNFNISGNGTAGGTLSGSVVAATTQFNIGSERVLSIGGNQNFFAGVGAGNPGSTGSNNLFVGGFAGNANTTGGGNAFVGTAAGASNTTGSSNSFVGPFAGFANTTGFENSFFGASAGGENDTGFRNSLFGHGAGRRSTASGNAFFGWSAGNQNTTGASNSFFGAGSGGFNTTGLFNSFFGSGSGASNTTGQNNTIIGTNADVASGDLDFASAIGAGAVVSNSNTIALGRSSGLDTVQIPGNLNVGGTFTGTFNGTIATADNALNLGGIAASQYVVTTDPRMTDARSPLAGSTSYIQNIPGVGTQSASFNIDGGGNASIFNATTQYNLGGSRVLSVAGTGNLFAGLNAGFANTTGFANTFVGSEAGRGSTTGFGNSFFGLSTGQNNTAGSSNSFVGGNAGLLNTTGSDNSLMGRDAGLSNVTGNENSFFGSNAGRANTTGSSNTSIGYFADVGSDLTNSTAIGARAQVTQNNTLILGSTAGINGATESTKVGIGTTNPLATLQVSGSQPPDALSGTSAAPVLLVFGPRGGFGGSGGDGAEVGIRAGDGGGGVFGGGRGAGVFIRAGDGGSGSTSGGLGGTILLQPGQGGPGLTSGSHGNVNLSPLAGTNVGIGTTNPKTKLEVAGGSVFISDAGSSLILSSPNGACWALSVSNTGVLSTTSVTCP